MITAAWNCDSVWSELAVMRVETPAAVLDV